MESVQNRDTLEKSAVEVVLVDDDADSLSELEEFLNDSDYRCRSFAVPEQALDHLRQRHAPVVLVSDVRMPKMSGLELSRLTREMEGDRHPVEIILYSGHGGFDEAVQSLKYGVVDFLLKPIDPARLEQTIQRAIERISTRLTQQQRAAEAAAASHVPQTPHAPAPARPRQPIAVAGNGGPSLALIKLLQNNRRTRDRLFPACSVGDPSWEIILFVLEQEMLQRPVSVTSACHATAIPQTTAMRKIDELVDAQLLSRVPDEDDRRRVLLCSTQACRDAAKRYFETTLGQLVSSRPLLDPDSNH